MNEAFRAIVESLHEKMQQLLAISPATVEHLPRKMPAAGIYLFSEANQHVYVGRSNRLRSRLQEHSRPSSDRFNATFAFRIACAQTGQQVATYKKNASRANLMHTPVFRDAFIAAKQRVRKMLIRFVEENDPVRQALLEIYAAVALKTPYNDFDTH